MNGCAPDLAVIETFRSTQFLFLLGFLNSFFATNILLLKIINNNQVYLFVHVITNEVPVKYLTYYTTGQSFLRLDSQQGTNKLSIALGKGEQVVYFFNSIHVSFL